jgi:hypothetical protein
VSRPQVLHDGTGVILEVPGVGILQAYGATVPSEGAAGYAPGCIFHHTDGSAGTCLYCNEGSVTSADFDAVTVA